jgi:hypothetical protein
LIKVEAADVGLLVSLLFHSVDVSLDFLCSMICFESGCGEFVTFACLLSMLMNSEP